ncbi:MAG: DUF2284 domain-containing protein [Candidatus Brocadiia bacterium]|nr:MAG: DUF2284 domain-containing protein [Candidatus Brocadiia bacterium]
MTDLNKLIAKAKEFGAAAAAVLKTSDIQFHEEFRKLCQQNSCGKYGTNWMCPPAAGPFEELKAKVLKLSKGFVFQTVHKLEDSFDYDGMIRALEEHDKIFRNILRYIRSDSGCKDVFPLNVGECRVCQTCTYLHGQKCRFPDKAVASIESYGIDVNALVTGCGIAYNNGPDTVSFVGLFLF